MLQNHQRIWPAVVLVAGVLAGCSNETPKVDTIPGRWYSAEQVEQGRALYAENCQSCHGGAAAGTSDWRKTDASGNYPPPPLNGTAHTWHHPMPILERTIADGGIPLGGVMPGFSDKLSQEESRATIAYFQSLWPEEIYLRWQEINNR